MTLNTLLVQLYGSGIYCTESAGCSLAYMLCDLKKKRAVIKHSMLRGYLYFYHMLGQLFNNTWKDYVFCPQVSGH